MTRKKSTKIVNPRFAKTSEYREVIGTIEKVGQCPFCPDNFRYHKKPILKKLNGWFITENSWPYKNSQKHFLIISSTHKETLTELSAQDIESVLRLSKWGVKKYKIPGGALTMRFGESDFTGATVSHLHAHLIYPARGKGHHSKTVMFPIG